MPAPSDPELSSRMEPERGAAASGPARRGRKLRRGLAVSLLSLVLAILAAEVALRVSGHRARVFEQSVNKTIRRWVELTRAGIFEEIDDPVRRYAMRPGSACTIDGWTFRVSNRRTRGPDVPALKPPGEKRLLMLGDSFCFGLWCDEDETLVGHLARMANERELALGSGVTWRPLNLGVPGYTTGQQQVALEQDGLALEPDLVVVYFNTNDMQRQGFFFDDELGVLRNDWLPLPTGLRRALWSSHLYGALARWHYRRYEALPAPHLDPRAPWAHVRADNQADCARALARIAELCRTRSIPLFFVDQPLMVWQGGAATSARDPNWPILPLVRWAEERRAELGLPGIDLTGWMRGYSDNVDRVASTPAGELAPPPDFLHDVYFGDERVEALVAWARDRARELGQDWDQLRYDERLAILGQSPDPLPEEVDFHLTGAGYADLARLIHPELQRAGLLP
jgi:hypothetical protein